MQYVYLLRCADGTLYCGWTTDLGRRLAVHNRGVGAKYTRSRLPVELAYYEGYMSRTDALRREYEIKQMKRKEKEELIRGKGMLFGKKKKETVKTFDSERYTPVLRCSICTGEQVAGFRDKETGKFLDVMLIRGEEDLSEFRETYGVGENIAKEY